MQINQKLFPLIYKVRNVVDNDVVKISFYDKLVTKVNAVETSVFVLRTLYNNNKSRLEKKMMMLTKKS